MQISQRLKVRLRLFKRDHPFQKDVYDAIKPVYEALSDNYLLLQCIGVNKNTPNSKECFDSTVWRLAAKHLHCGYKTVKIPTISIILPQIRVWQPK